MPDYGSPQAVLIISAVVQLVVFGLVVWLIIYLASSRRRNRRQQLTAGTQGSLPRPNIAAITDAQQARFVVSPATLDWSPEHVLRGIAAEQATARYLAELDDNWYVMHSRLVPGTNIDLDHVVIGPNVIAVVDSKDWSGRLWISPDAETVELNNTPGLLEKQLQSVAYERHQVAARLNLAPPDVKMIVTFSDRMTFPGDTVGFILVEDDEFAANVTVMKHSELVPYLEREAATQRRPMVMAHPTQVNEVVATGYPPEAAHWRAQVEFAAGMARQAAVTFPDAAVVPYA